MINSFKVTVFSVPLLQIEIFLQLNIGNTGIKFNDIVPKLLLLVVCLLYFPDGHIGGAEDS
jgi:hypothetical protein